MTINKDGRIGIFDSQEKTLYIVKRCLEQNLFKAEERLSFIQAKIECPLSAKIMFADFG